MYHYCPSENAKNLEKNPIILKSMILPLCSKIVQKYERTVGFSIIIMTNVVIDIK